ncbi:hypothetical protein DSO57_1036231 [Entomophthora muscae]|uniref:Uncharacterized protein n=1 Tax=Entomophthora muscae TaxID=34485 RepID=A0ACC2SNE4_9FUNG|nr:hypothetical protein DSO57_1036231 [Entomophthora muscae]
MVCIHPPYYAVKYFYLTTKYVTDLEKYKTQIQQYEHEGKAKLADEFHKAWSAMNESDGGGLNLSPQGSLHSHRDLFTQYYEASSEWFKVDVEEIWQNYARCTS